ncbi:RNA polymerase Rpc34 subunit-domain-containing protein [Papiliotrema laurentii]|uniref:RNA polymerase Rpc34 subunit-domain-containing protein n=1 Tax=Papiliotrema laurentii TaxID=5418 RepID=A0AAD9CUU1_PAPLA|nr:RNA polymerase Rpc34 subunit-domain-containing protein [Papiliotrema laurentii]
MSSKPAAGPSGTAGPDGPKPNGAAAMANRPAISKLSMHIWQMVKQAKNKTMSEAQILAGVNQSGKPKLTVAEVGPAIVDLMKKKLLGSSKGPDGTRLFHWQSREGASSLEANTPEMNMCWSFISQAGNKGTTAKAIRMKIGPDRITPTAVRRALDALVRAQQIKIFKSIQHPTMQLYVLADTTPDEGMTGGIWYDGNKEYDSAFVTGITKVLLTHVRTKSWATNDKRPEAKKLVSNPIYAPGKGPALPSPRDLLKYCQDTRVVNAPLTLKNVMECMRALELDGLVEVIKPAYHVAGGSDDDEYQPRPSKRAKTDVDSDEEERKAEQRREKQKEKLRRKAEAKKAKEKERRKKEKEKAKRKKEKKKRERAERKAAKKKKEKEKDSAKNHEAIWKVTSTWAATTSSVRSAISRTKAQSPSPNPPRSANAPTLSRLFLTARLKQTRIPTRSATATATRTLIAIPRPRRSIRTTLTTTRSTQTIMISETTQRKRRRTTRGPKCSVY